jgi:hypothetical protein
MCWPFRIPPKSSSPPTRSVGAAPAFAGTSLGPVKQGNTYGVAVHAMPAPAEAGDRGRRHHPRLPGAGWRRRLDPSGPDNDASSGSSVVRARISALARDGGAGQGSAGTGCDGDGGGRPRGGYLPQMGDRAREGGECTAGQFPPADASDGGPPVNQSTPGNRPDGDRVSHAVRCR